MVKARPAILIVVDGGIAEVITSLDTINYDLRDNDNYEASETEQEKAIHAPFTELDIKATEEANRKFELLFNDMADMLRSLQQSMEEDQESGEEDGIYEKDQNQTLDKLNTIVYRVDKFQENGHTFEIDETKL
jgi:hypothetical protein